ncbi:hypothetical protein JVT61DRAFT_3234 [Boletus reticuloceps]|uniref:Uncharacterized protein n=1 Tax=Boletus reticuloceps TaxID=495285 RepID=A0A8I2YQP6_9AGAM|nr:hypothetical protein JVT61DRAFT_3234 [Boletus reticuloceps]
MSSVKVQVILVLLILLRSWCLFMARPRTISLHTPLFICPVPISLLLLRSFDDASTSSITDSARQERSYSNLTCCAHFQKTVIVVSGESAREAFFANRALDITEGFKVLSGAIPMVKGVTSELQTRRIALIHKRLVSLQRNAHLEQLIAPILKDCHRVMDTWGSSGTLDPFEKIYELVFQITVRSLASQEIADDSALVARLKSLYDILDSETTPTTVLLPWLPFPSMLRKLLATKEVYSIVSRTVDIRLKSGNSRNDSLQMLIDAQDERLVIVGVSDLD